MANNDEYKELFLSEAQDSYEELNTLFTQLEKDSSNQAAIKSIFRITHTLKGNAMGLGFKGIAAVSHAMEDIFNAINKAQITLDDNLFETLFRANDLLGRLIEAAKTGEKVSYRGLTTKLKVFLRNATNKTSPPVSGTEEQKTAQEKEPSVPQEQLLKSQVTLSDMVQVPVRKLNDLLDIVGELMIEKDTLAVKSMDSRLSSSDMVRLDRITSDLQYSVMDIRLVQIGFMFKKFHRIVRDTAKLEQKKVDLELKGTSCEIDRNVLKIMSDSLVHLVRNAVSHGIEPPKERLKKGKPEAGTITLNAQNNNDRVVIEINDDGAGIDVENIRQKAIQKGLTTAEKAQTLSDQEVIRFLFESGFSSAEKITEVSGRGVGLDVVRIAAEEIGGEVSVSTVLGQGSTFRLSLPLSMTVKGALLFELYEQTFAIALSYTEAVLALRKQEIHKMNHGLIARYLDKTISIVFLRDLFEAADVQNLENQKRRFHQTFDQLSDNTKLELVVVTYNNKMLGLVVDKLVQQKEIIEKKLAKPVQSNALFSGATILGNGEVCLVLNIASIVTRLH